MSKQDDEKDLNEILGEVPAPRVARLPMGTITMKNADGKYTAIADCWFAHGKTGAFLKCAVKADVELKAQQQLFVFTHSSEYRLGYFMRGETIQ